LAIANVNNDEGTINIFLFAANETDGASGSLIEIDFQRHESPTDDQPPKIDVESLRINDGDKAMVSAIGDGQVKISPPSPSEPSPGDAPQVDRPLSDMVDATGELVVRMAAPTETGGDVAVIAVKPMIDASPTGFQTPPTDTDEPAEGDNHESAAAPSNVAPPPAIDTAPPAAIDTAPPESLADHQETRSSVTSLQHPPAVCIPGQRLPIVYGPDRFVDEPRGDDFAGAQSVQGPSPVSARLRGDEWNLAGPSGIVSAPVLPVPGAKIEPQTQAFTQVNSAQAIASPSKNAATALAVDVELAKRTAGIVFESPRPSKTMATAAPLPIFWKIVDRGAADPGEESVEDTTV
jgi:hypothetical protein